MDPNDNRLNLVATQYLAPILERGCNVENMRKLADKLKVPYAKRHSKAIISRPVAKTLLMYNSFDIINYYVDWAESFYKTRLYGDPTNGKLPDRHKIGLYETMLNRVEKVREYVNELQVDNSSS